MPGPGDTPSIHPEYTCGGGREGIIILIPGAGRDAMVAKNCMRVLHNSRRYIPGLVYLIYLYKCDLVATMSRSGSESSSVQSRPSSHSASPPGSQTAIIVLINNNATRRRQRRQQQPQQEQNWAPAEEDRRPEQQHCVRHVDKNSEFRARYEVSLANFITKEYYTHLDMYRLFCRCTSSASPPPSLRSLAVATTGQLECRLVVIPRLTQREKRTACT